MLNYQLQIVGDEFVTSTGHDDEFYVNLLFDRSIYRPISTHMGKYFKHSNILYSYNYMLILEQINFKS